MNRFDYIKYDDKAIATQAAFKQLFENLDRVVGTLPPGRATSLVYTKLEEAYMWVGKAIRDEQVARSGSVQEQPERSNS